MTQSLTTEFIRKKDLGSDGFSLAEKLMDLYVSSERFETLISIFIYITFLVTLVILLLHMNCT